MRETSLKFKDYDYSNIDRVETLDSVGKIVKVYGYVSHLGEFAHRETAPGQYKGYSRARIADEDGAEMETADFDKKKYRLLRRYQKAAEPIEVLAEVVKEEIKGERLKNRLQVIKVRSGSKPLRRLQARRRELGLVRTFLKVNEENARDSWWLFQAIREDIKERLNIVGTEMDELYSDALEVMICQAFSGGRVGHTNGKIHTCVIGPPATGKKLLWQSAQMINVTSEEAHPIRTTEAGVTAIMSAKDGVWTVKPGKIPLANQGVFGIQDFDKAAKKPELLAIFGMVMEDGCCLISGAGRKTLEAEVAIHIDLNRRSDMVAETKSKRQAMEEIELPIYILSRFDYITELRENLALQAEKSHKLLETAAVPKTDGQSKIARYCAKHALNPERFLKVLVGYVATRYETINSDQVNSLMLAKFREIEEVNKESLTKMSKIAAFQMRLVNTLQKLVIALTRVQLRETANKKAVEKAFHFLSRKLDFLKSIDERYLVPGYRTTGLQAFQRWLCVAYGTKKFGPEKVIERYRKEGYPCGEVKPRNIRIWIGKTAFKQKHGVWRIKKSVREEYGECHT
jgi:hypothetical protein